MKTDSPPWNLATNVPDEFISPFNYEKAATTSAETDFISAAKRLHQKTHSFGYRTISFD